MQKSLFLFLPIILLLILGNPVHGNSFGFVTDMEKTPSGVELSNSGNEFVSEQLITKVDVNGDKISDFFPDRKGHVSSLVLFEDFSQVPQSDEFYGIPILQRLTRLPVVEMSLTTQDISLLTSLPSVRMIEENSKLQPHLIKSTTQMGVRSHLWDLGYTGSSQSSIAILDSGIDFTHQAFTNRIIATYNALDNNQTLALDDDGHGTHVAGIAAGALDFDNDILVETSRGELPDECLPNECFSTLDFQLPFSGSGFTEFTVEIDWENKGVDNPSSTVGIAVIDGTSGTLACDDCLVEDSSGKFTFTFNLAENPYFIGFVNSGGATGSQYEATVEYTLSNPVDDSYANAAGVAYQNNIVVLKLVDSLGNGDITTFENAVNWLINNHDEYNITVINLSFGITGVSSVVDTLISDLADEGILSVVSAGNEGVFAAGIPSPGSAPEALTVGAVNNINELTFYSSMGTNRFNGDVMKPDILAPGGSSASRVFNFNTENEVGFGRILSADANLFFNLRNNDVTANEGTSMSAPHIAGLAALLVQYLIDNGKWSGSRSDIMKVKRAILAGSFEVANIGVGREEDPGANYDNYEPTIDRATKDFHEGWGAVDARAALDALSQEIKVGDTYTLSMSYLDPYNRKVSAWTLHAEPNINYGFFLDVPEDVDAEILIVPVNEGPSHEGTDYGDLMIASSSFSGLGVSEKIGLPASTTAKDYFVIVRMGDGLLELSELTFSVVEVDDIPSLTITSPTEGMEYSSNSLVVEFTTNADTVEGYLDGVKLSSIASGDTLDNLLSGDHVLRLIAILNGLTYEQKVTFTIIADFDTPRPNPLYFSSFLSSTFILGLIVIIGRKSIRR